MNRRDFLKTAGLGVASLAGASRLTHAETARARRPNFLFIITDDQSWQHVGCYGDRAVRTPSMDDLANNGVRFTNAYCAAPSCSPSRAAILTGQDIYRLEEGGILTGFIRDKFDVFPLILAAVCIAGWFIYFVRSPSFAILPRLYGVDVAGRISGVHNTFASLGALVLPFFLGYVRDVTESYWIGWVVLSGLLALGTIVTLFLRVSNHGQNEP